MKTVGKQLQEARLAKNWTPELAARETKIKVDRLRDLEGDDYSNFTSPTYARGFVRTYARALGLDEYRILRQLDNKLPDDDSANIVTDNSGVAYLPETAMPSRVAHRDFTGLYVVAGLGVVVTAAIVFVLFEAYRVGELQRYFGKSDETVASASSSTNAAPTSTNSDGTVIARALPIDSNTPPSIVDATNSPDATNAAAATNAPADVAAGTNAPAIPRAMPVDPNAVVSSGDTNAIPVAPIAPRALPVNGTSPATPTVATQTPSVPPPIDPTPAPTEKVPPRAMPVSPSELAAATAEMSAAASTTNAPAVVALNTPAPVNVPPAPAPIHTSSSARESNSGPVTMPSPQPVAPPAGPMIGASAATATANPAAVPAPAAAGAEKRLLLTASQDSFVRVTRLDGSDADKPLYAAVLHSGQSVGFDGRKFSINVGVPSAVDIKLDGVNYGPHSDQESPETFTVQSHLP